MHHGSIQEVIHIVGSHLAAGRTLQASHALATFQAIISSLLSTLQVLAHTLGSPFARLGVAAVDAKLDELASPAQKLSLPVTSELRARMISHLEI